MKTTYDKINKMQEPTYSIGDEVLLKTHYIPGGSNGVLASRPYSGPYLIRDIIKFDDNIGPAFKLIHNETGREIR